MKVPKSPAKIVAWSIAFFVVSFFVIEMATLLRVVGTERVNRRTKVSIENSQMTVEMTLPKGMWSVQVADADESVEAFFKLKGDDDHIRGFSSDRTGVVFHTERDFTKVVVECEFKGDHLNKFLEIRAVF